MKSALRPSHQLIIIALVLLIHGSMLMTFMIIEFQSGALEMPKHEAIVMMEEEKEAPQEHAHWVAMSAVMPNAQTNWVAMNAVMPNAQAVAQESESPSSEQPQPADTMQVEQQSETQKHHSELTAQENIDDAIALATQILDLKQPEKIQSKELTQSKAISPTAHITKNSPESKNIPTLAQITQGFVAHLQQADMAVKSNRGGIASIDQIKHLNYCQKIIGCIVTTYKINNHTAPNKKMLDRRARVQLALNRNGTIAHLALQESSGDSAVDAFLLNMFKDASSSFPPVPAALTENPYQLPLFSIDSLESFRSTQGWHIDTTSI